MVSMEIFREWMDEILAEIPEEYFRDLNGGVLLLEEQKFHSKSIGDDLYVMGEYRRERGLGRYIVIFYGSFDALYGQLPEVRLKKRLRSTILHEFRHHVEFLAGEKDLEIEDQIQINRYLKKNQSR